MRVTINGIEKNYDQELDLTACMEHEGYSGKMVAVAVNGVFVPKSSHGETRLNDGDEIEIVAPMQGG